MKTSGVYSIYHIIYIIIALILMAVGLILTKKLATSQKAKNLIIKISGVILLITILINRFTVTYYDVIINQRVGYSFLNLIPNTFCGLASIVLSITIIFGKKDHLVLHFIGYLGFVGGLITIFYPDFLDSQAFFDIRSLTGLLHHTLMVWIVLVCLMTKYFIPSFKKWYIFPLGFSLMMTLGVLELDCFKFATAMQIQHPLLESLPILTSWYVIGILETLGVLVFTMLYEHLVNKVSFKQLFKIKDKAKD